MCQNEVKQTKNQMEKSLPAPISTLYRQAELVREFLAIVEDTLKKCMGIDIVAFDEDDEREFEIVLLFNTYDNEFEEIGYVKDCDYLLNHDFIFKRYLFLCKNDRQSYEKMKYFVELLSAGVLKPCINHKSNPLHTVVDVFDSEANPKVTKCVCIQSQYLNFDEKTMKVY